MLDDKDLAESNINQSTLEKIYMQGRKSTLSRAKKPVVVYSGVNEPLMQTQPDMLDAFDEY